MKFKIFSIYELMYKTVTYIIVMGVTIAAICYYFSLGDKSDTFIVATLYAMFLFIVGLYLSYMDKKIGDKIYERRSIYLNLLRIKDLLSEDNLDFSTTRNAKLTIIACRVLSGRSEESSSKEKKTAVFQTISLDNLIEADMRYQRPQNIKHHYIDENGFKFTSKIDKYEKEYLNLELSLQGEITNAINSYIESNQIKLKVLSFNELDLLDTNYEEWCDIYIDEVDERKESAKKYIYEKIESLRTRLDNLEEKRRNIEKYYKKCSKKIAWNIKRIETVYGDRLRHIISSDSNIMQALNEIKECLDEIQREQANYGQINDVEHSVEDCRMAINNLYSKVIEAEESIVASINILQDDIG